MKVLRLDLLAFGPFTDASLDFTAGVPERDVGRRLHLVYGQNEAGKSSTLRALRQWLYGIPHTSEDSYLHANTELRIGGVLEGPGGERLEFIRRKGRKQTLRGSDDREVIDDARLAALLAGVDETAFERRFGIDYSELHAGGEAVVGSGGDLGTLLYASGAGLANLVQVRRRLEEELDGLFRPRGTKPAINATLAELKSTRELLKESLVPTSAWESVDRELKQKVTRQDQVAKELAGKRARQSLLERVEQALPLLQVRERHAERLAELVEAPLLDEDFSARRRELEAGLLAARSDEASAAKGIAKYEEKMTGVQIPEGLLEHRPLILELHGQRGAHQKAAVDRPGLVAQVARLRQDADERLRELGRADDLFAAEQLRLTRTQRQQIQELADDFRVRQESRREAAESLTRLQDRARGLQTRRRELPGRQEVGALKQAVQRIQKRGDLDRQLAEARLALEGLVQQAEVELGKLRQWDRGLDELESLPVPARETIDRFEQELADANQEVQRRAEEQSRLQSRSNQLERQLSGLEMEGDVPSEAELHAARQRRETGWRLIRAIWREGADAESADAIEFAQRAGGDLAEAYQETVRETDELADRLRREADRVAEKSQLEAERQIVARELDDSTAALAAANERYQGCLASWEKSWQAAGLKPESPREMRTWLSDHARLVGLAEELRQQSRMVDAATAELNALRDELLQRVESLTGSSPESSPSLGGLLDACEGLILDVERSNQAFDDCQRELDQVELEVAEAERKLDRVEAELASWKEAWGKSVEVLGLEESAPPTLARSVIETGQEILDFLEDAEGTQKRIDGIDRDAKQFESDVRELLPRLAPDLVNEPLDRAIEQLQARCEAAGEAHARRTALEDQLEQEQSRRDEAKSRIDRLEVQLRQMCREAGVDGADELPAVEQRAKQKRELQSELDRIDERLEQLAAGESIDDWLSRVAEFEVDEVRAEIQSLHEEIERLVTEERAVNEAVGGLRLQLAQMDGSGRAAEASEAAEQLLARLRGQSEQYVRLRLGSWLLGRSIERFRESNRGPVLDRASQLFAELTLNSFSGLRVDLDERGNTVLVAERAGSGRLVPVTGLSEGTCDQLYLSLRLAQMERHVAHHPPFPFIIDDILVMFDDQRALAALRALGRLAEQTQVVFFTHHEHLVRLAEENLDADRWVTHTIDHRHSGLAAE